MVNSVSRRVAALINDAGHGASKRIADECGVQSSQVSRWKNGRATPPRKYWPTLEDFFGLEPGELTQMATGASEEEHLDLMVATLDRLQGELDALRQDVDELWLSRRRDARRQS